MTFTYVRIMKDEFYSPGTTGMVGKVSVEVEHSIQVGDGSHSSPFHQDTDAYQGFTRFVCNLSGNQTFFGYGCLCLYFFQDNLMIFDIR